MYLTHYRNLSQDVLKLLSLLFFVEIVEGKYQGSFTRVLKVIWDDINSINQSINQSKNKHDRNWTHDRFRFRPGIIIIGHVTPNQTITATFPAGVSLLCALLALIRTARRRLSCRGASSPRTYGISPPHHTSSAGWDTSSSL